MLERCCLVHFSSRSAVIIITLRSQVHAAFSSRVECGVWHAKELGSSIPDVLEVFPNRSVSKLLMVGFLDAAGQLEHHTRFWTS